MITCPAATGRASARTGSRCPGPAARPSASTSTHTTATSSTPATGRTLLPAARRALARTAASRPERAWPGRSSAAARRAAPHGGRLRHRADGSRRHRPARGRPAGASGPGSSGRRPAQGARPWPGPAPPPAPVHRRLPRRPGWAAWPPRGRRQRRLGGTGGAGGHPAAGSRCGCHRGYRPHRSAVIVPSRGTSPRPSHLRQNARDQGRKPRVMPVPPQRRHMVNGCSHSDTRYTANQAAVTPITASHSPAAGRAPRWRAGWPPMPAPGCSGATVRGEHRHDPFCRIRAGWLPPRIRMPPAAHNRADMAT